MPIACKHLPSPLRGEGQYCSAQMLSRHGAGPSPSTGEGGVGVRLGGAEQPSVFPLSPPSPARGEGVLTSPCELSRWGGMGGGQC
jgi:hypothetical protein